MYDDFEKIAFPCQVQRGCTADNCITSESAANRTVNFCCSTNLPDPFVLAEAPAIRSPKILYSLDNLSCKIEPCCDANCQTRYNIVIVGCIPFIADAGVRVVDDCTSPTGSAIRISASCCVSVDTTVCTACTLAAAIKACARIEAKLESCSCVTVSNLAANESGNCTVIFTGAFILPDCSAVAANCQA